MQALREEHSELYDVADNTDVPLRTKIYYSMSRILFTLILAMLIILLGTGAFLDSEGLYRLIGVAVAGIGLYMLVTNYNHPFDRSPQIIIDHTGILTQSAGFQLWSAI